MTETFLTDRFWLWIAAALYSGGFLLGAVPLLRRRRHPARLVCLVMLAGFALQTLGLWLRGKTTGGCPVGNTFEILQFTTWSAVALYFIVGAVFRLSLPGFFTAAFASLISLVSLAVPEWDAARRIGMADGASWVGVHAALAIFSYGAFGLLALTSAMWLLQWFSVKRRRMDGIFSLLPPMLALDRINLRLLATGVVILGASLVVALLHRAQIPGHAVNLAMIFLGALWLVYAALLGLRLSGIMPSRRLAWACIILFALAILSLGTIDNHRGARASVQPTEQQP